jgi:hippurate hydrolase
MIDGARAMLAAHLYERFGKPDLAVALHDTNTLAAGTVSIVSGPMLAAGTSVDVLLRGIGSHSARPQEGKDPIVMAGEFIVQLQTIVSRQENPRDPVAVSIGDIHGGDGYDLGGDRSAAGVAFYKTAHARIADAEGSQSVRKAPI